MRRAVAAAGAVGLITLGACGGDEPSRPDAMAAVASDVAVPAFEEFAAAAATVVDDVGAACAAPDAATVQQALASVEAARAAWVGSQAVWTGPVMDERSEGLIDWSVDVDEIDELVAGGDELTVEFVATNVGADNRGLRALHHALSSDGAVERLGETRWCEYAESVAAVVAEEADAVLAAWTTDYDGGGPFAETIAADDEAQDWLAMLVNDEIQLAHAATEPVREDAPPDPALDRATQLRALAATATALAPLLGDDLSARLGEQLDAAIAAFDAGDLDQGRELAAEVERILGADVAGKLDVAISFSDADGDSSG